MKKKAIGINDIAKQLKVSATTVSFILNGKAKEKRISDKLTKKVIRYVNKVGYSPNHLAKSLRTGKTNLIGLIVEDISNPFFANVARLIEENAYDKGFRIMYCSSENDTEKTRELIKVFRDRHVDAYIITPPAGTEEDVQALLNEGSTVVLFDRFYANVSSNYVVVDNEGGSYSATKHLIEQGYKNIAFVTLKSDQTQMNDRLNGYKNAIKENKLKSYITKIPFHPASHNYTSFIVDFFNKNKNIDAVFFATNYLGISGLEAIKNLNRKIPGDIGVVSFDDHDLFRLYSPAVTVVAQPIEEMSQQVINIVLEELDDKFKSKEALRIVLPVNFIIRNSSVKK